MGVIGHYLLRIKMSEMSHGRRFRRIAVLRRGARSVRPCMLYANIGDILWKSSVSDGKPAPDREFNVR